MTPFVNRKNQFNLEWGNLQGHLNDALYTYINDSMVGDGLIWNGSTLTGPAYINCFAYGITGTTSVASQSTWYKLEIETTEGWSRDGFLHSNNRITNTGRTRIIRADAIVSISSGNNNVIHFHLRAILINSMEIRHDKKLCTHMIYITPIQLINHALK